VLEAGGTRLAGQVDRNLQVVGDGLFAIDVLAGIERLGQQLCAHQRGSGIEEDGVIGIGERSIEIGRPALDVMLAGKLLHLRAVAADDDRIDFQFLA